MFFLKRVNSNSDYERLAKSRYFNRRWYLKEYSDVAAANMDPVEHYMKYGWREGRNPGPKFSTQYYLYLNSDVRKAKMNPLLHYEKYGKKEKRLIFPVKKSLLKKFFEQIYALITYYKYSKYYILNNKIYKNGKDLYAPNFSFIMPTYNREGLICKAIDSVLNQSYQNFELIIVDDGSTDKTKERIFHRYEEEIKQGKIKYFKKENAGVCKARNFGLTKAQNEWIAYIDSDNEIIKDFLKIFVINIVEHPQKKAFYGKMRFIFSNRESGKKFNIKEILKKNYIDLGTFVHHKDLYHIMGGFDENMTRLVDWELIVRYSKKYVPYFIKTVVLFYNDSNEHARITNTVDYENNLNYFKSKHCLKD